MASSEFRQNIWRGVIGYPHRDRWRGYHSVRQILEVASTNAHTTYSESGHRVRMSRFSTDRTRASVLSVESRSTEDSDGKRNADSTISANGSTRRKKSVPGCDPRRWKVRRPTCKPPFVNVLQPSTANTEPIDTPPATDSTPARPDLPCLLGG